MIHNEGFVHADTHSGNLMVRKNKVNHAELVILDHGLYQ
jgi:predicted unusual protein kinase regulating ubiquinone biosynthesis (AarF/ABC1/UbiB family)